MKDFVVIDTEGRETLTEIAIIDSKGHLCYEANCKQEDHKFNDPQAGSHLKTQPLVEIVKAVETLCAGKIIVCHYADHDAQILRRSFAQVGRLCPRFQFVCSYELAQKHLPGKASYNLGFLCKLLDLRVQGQRFDDRQAHRACYDATFTYKLYCYLYQLSLPQPPMSSSNLAKIYQNTPNPFRSSRVDNPFQDYPDCQTIYSPQFTMLKTALAEIQLDANHQSQGVVVIGEPGSGKTHLMMRLAQQVLITNRLFFVRHPNNAKAVQYHIYARMLESFAEWISPGSSHTQLEQLLAHSFVNILRQTDWSKTKNGEKILDRLKNNSLDLYKVLGTHGTDVHRKNWDAIERFVLQWWEKRYSYAGYGATILQGILRFCRYTDRRYKDLIMRWLAGHGDAGSEDLEKVGLQPWPEELSQEEFALEAIQTFGRLSLLDQPLIFVFDQLESLGEERNKAILESFGSATKELLTQVPNSLVILNLFPDRWRQFQQAFDGSVVDRVSQWVVTLERPSRDQLIVLLDTLCSSDPEVQAPHPRVKLDELLTPQELEEVLAQMSLRAIIKRASDYFRWKVADITLPPLDKGNKPGDEAQNLLDEQQQAELQQWKAELLQAYQAFSEVLHKILLPDDIPPPPLPPPPIDQYWEGIYKEWQGKYDRSRILSDTDDLGKLMTIVSAFSQCLNITVDQLSYGKRVLPEHICIRTATQTNALGFLGTTSGAFTSRIKNFNQLVLSNKDIQFRLTRDVQHPEIRSGTIGHDEIEKLQAAANGDYVLMDRDDRIIFECLHQLICDFENQDLEFETSIPQIVDWMTAKLPDYWIVRACTK